MELQWSHSKTRCKLQEAEEGMIRTLFSHQGWFSCSGFSLLRQDVCASPAPRRIYGYRWAAAVLGKPVLQMLSGFRDQWEYLSSTFCENEVSRLCQWLQFAVKEEEEDPRRSHCCCAAAAPSSCIFLPLPTSSLPASSSSCLLLRRRRKRLEQCCLFTSLN